jgi:hypothetical protein
MNRTSIRFLAVAATAALSLSAVSVASAAAPSYKMEKKAYGKRYCEMAAAFINGSGLKVVIYNTFAKNDCPTASWNSAIAPAAVSAAKTALGAVQVITNGPRWWVFDEIGGVLDPKVVKFGNLATNKAAVLNFPTMAIPTSFTEWTVSRTSTWVYNKGTYLRVITSPAGKKYVMQAYTTQVSTKVKASNLNTLASGKNPLITLPAGWKYSAYKAKSKLTLVAPGTMTIVQDNLKNTYSLMP